jgi:hypothetical protein
MAGAYRSDEELDEVYNHFNSSLFNRKLIEALRNSMSIDDSQRIIDRSKCVVDLLLELKMIRVPTKGKIDHSPLAFRLLMKGGVFEVTCNCGGITKYQVPLNNISEFKCPKDRK